MSSRANARALLTLLLAGILGGRPARAYGREGEPRTPAPAKIQVLEVGQPLQGEVAGDRSSFYQVTLSAGQFMDVVWELGDPSALRSRLSGPDGERLFERNAGDGRDGVMWIAEKPGEYRIELAAVSPDTPPASYTVSLAARREATPDDHLRIRAQRLSRAGHELIGGTEASGREAISKFEESLGLWRTVGDGPMERDTLLWMGAVYKTLGEIDKSLEVYQKGVLLAHSAGNVERESVALNNMGTVYGDRRDLELALECLERAASIRRAAGLPVSAGTLHNIAGIHEAWGEWQQALDSYREALRLVREAHDRWNEAVVLDTIGRVYSALGENRRAIEYYRQALPLKKATRNVDGEATTLVALAEVHFELGERAEALDSMGQALALVRQTGTRRIGAFAFRAMGRIQYELGAMKEALAYARESLSLAEGVGNRGRQGQSLNLMGMALAAMGEPEQAAECFQRALGLLQNNDRGERLRSLYGLARVERNRGRLADARAHLETALGEVESLRTKVASPTVRASYFSLARKNYELYIDVLMRQHQDDPRSALDVLAFEVSERARARALLELLGESAADIREGVDRKLLDEERLVRRRLSSKTDAQMRLLGAKAGPQELAAVSRDIDSLSSQLDQIEVEIRQRSPRYAALAQPRPLALPEIQAEVLDADTALLEYAVGEERSFLWVVTAASVDSHELPGRPTIEGLAREAREALSRRPPAGAGPAMGGRPDAQRALAALGRAVLGPVGPQLAGKRLLVVADDALQYIPFAALSIDEAGAPLVAGHEIVTLPSASVLPLLRRERRDRRSPTKTLAVFADPVFEKDDERVRHPRGEVRPSAATVAQDSGRERSAIRAAQEAGLRPGSMRLPFTLREARAILSLVAAKERKEAIGFDASRDVATGPDLAEYRFVHFATHGFANAEQPELSGVVLSLIDRAGREQDGFLSAADIFNLRLSADLVVLSGCRTGLGKDVRGEGLVGLTRAFMYAGAGHVMASLWNVDDAATAELMKRFYGEMLGPRRSSPAAALRAAQRGMRDTQRWRAPFYWSGFVVQGDWK